MSSVKEAAPDAGSVPSPIHVIHNAISQFSECLDFLNSESTSRKPSREGVASALEQIKLASVLKNEPLCLLPFLSDQPIEIETELTLHNFREEVKDGGSLADLDIREESHFGTGTSWHHYVVEVSANVYSALDSLRDEESFAGISDLDFKRFLDAANIAIESFRLPVSSLLRGRLQRELFSALATKASPSKATKAIKRVQRDTKADARDAWMYRLAVRKNNPLTFRAIMQKLRQVAGEKGWTILGSPTAVQQAINRHIKREGLEPLSPRKEA